MSTYKILRQQVYTSGVYSLVPIRPQDRYDIMRWRNEQMYHLRQNQPLAHADQDYYFDNTVAKLFYETEPHQLLLSYLENGICIGYGGLVHINWRDRNAEISFIMDTEFEKKAFEKHWSNHLGLITKVAFSELALHKIYTYAFDLRKHLYPILEGNGFKKDATLKEHCLFDGAYMDVVIHYKINSNARNLERIKTQ